MSKNLTPGLLSHVIRLMRGSVPGRQKKSAGKTPKHQGRNLMTRMKWIVLQHNLFWNPGCNRTPDFFSLIFITSQPTAGWLNLRRILGFPHRFLLIYNAFINEHFQALIQSLHAMGLAGLDSRIHLRNFIFPDQVPDR